MTQPPEDGQQPDNQPPVSQPPDKVLGERYEVGALIGRGGMADVRIGHDVRLGRAVAIKRLRPDLASDPTFQARFRREAQSAASLNHPSIVAVYDTGEEVAPDGTHVPYIVMEHVEGRTLREILREGRKILPERALEITADVLSALDYSHRAGIVHRDIKPANVMLTPPGRVKVMDFGIARAVADASSTMTATAAVVGTAQYLSPEQARGEQVDARSDIYSTGCLLFELLTARPPFQGDSPVSVAYQHVREEPPLASSLEPEVSTDVDAIVTKALAKKTADRYQSAAAMRADIERVLAGRPVDATTTNVLAPVPVPVDTTSSFLPEHDDEDEEPPRRSRAWIWVLLALVLLAALAGGAYALVNSGGDDATGDVSVPDVLGARVNAATQEIEAENLEVETVREASDEEPGTVIDQDPDAGDLVGEGDTVTLAVSAGPDTVDVPLDLVGMKRRDAEVAIKGAGLEVGTPVFELNDAPQGEVLAASPSSGTPVPPGSEVVLTVSEGPILVPSVVGESQESAEALIEGAGLVPTVSPVVNGNVEPGTVTRQEPPAETPATEGDVVTIYVAVAPETTEPTTTEPTTTEPTTTEPTTTEPTTTEPTTTEPTTTETTEPNGPKPTPATPPTPERR